MENFDQKIRFFSARAPPSPENYYILASKPHLETLKLSRPKLDFTKYYQRGDPMVEEEVDSLMRGNFNSDYENSLLACFSSFGKCNSICKNIIRSASDTKFIKP